MNKYFELRYLSNNFLKKYPEIDYPEFENKKTRSYIVFLIQVDNHTFAIPFRTNMNHKYGYIFLTSGRKTNSKAGLDFTKAVLVDDFSMLGAEAIIDNKERLEISEKHFFIRKKFIVYYENYKRYLKHELNEYQSKAYYYSTLKYFHKELGIK